MVIPKERNPGKISSSRRWREPLATILLFGFGILCQLPVLSTMFPSLDDSGYLFDGVRLVEQGTWMPLGSGPLSGILNGAIYLFFPHDHMLLGYVSIFRRVILLIGIMAAAGIAGKSVGGKWGGWAAMAVAAVARPVTTVLMVTADSLYAALAGLSFAVIVAGWIAEKQSGKSMRSFYWIGAGLLLGLAALTRLDGLLLGVLLIPVLWFFRGRNGGAARTALIFGGSFLLPVVIYIFIYAAATGSWDPQIGQRSYLAFEQGHNFLYAGRYEVVPSPSAADLYGTAEQNGNSVLRAIARNPRAFLRRLPLVAANAVRMYYDAYSILGGAMLLFLAAGGAAVVWGGPRRLVLGLALLWCLPLLGYSLASYRPGFFGMLLPVLLTLAIAGSVPAIVHFRSLLKSDQVSLLAVWLLVAAGMLGSQAAYLSGQYRGWGAARQAESAYRGWLTELSAQVPRGECVIAFNATDAIYSNHSVYGNWQLFYLAEDPDQLRTAMRGAGCRYLVVDSDLRTFAPKFIPVVETTLHLEYTSRDGLRMIYMDENDVE
jgi:hypothetical protein